MHPAMTFPEVKRENKAKSDKSIRWKLFIKKKTNIRWKL
jgi:hypothetical protein